MTGKRFLVDTIANITYWHVILGICEIIFFGYTIPEMLSARAGNFLLSLIMGGFYGQAIDIGRKLLNKKHYLETKGKKRTTNWKTITYDAVIDGLITTVFWNIIFSLWLHYVTGLGWTHILWASMGYTLIYILFGGLYGRYLDLCRKHFLNKKKGKKRKE